MAVMTLLGLVLLGGAAGLLVRHQRRAFAVRRYEQAYSAIDAAVDRARVAGTVPLLNPSSGADTHVALVPPPERRRAGDTGVGDDAPGVSPPLAG